MGGIKNKLNKLSNKAKNLFNALSLKERADERSSSGEVNSKEVKGSRLPSFSQPFEMLTRNISNTRTSNWWSLHASKTIGSLRLVTLTKYLAISCFTLAILSTLILNIVSSYSSSKIESNAEEVGSNSNTSTLANDSSSISLSFSNATGSCSDTSSPANVCMEISDDGGIATGGHRLIVNAGSSVAKYQVSLSSVNEETSLVNQSDSSQIISAVGADFPDGAELEDGEWGYSVALSDDVADRFAGLKPNATPDIIMDVEQPGQDVNWRYVSYGVKIDNPVQKMAGEYARAVQYTASGTIKPPVITSISPNQYELGSDDGLDEDGFLHITISGENLSGIRSVQLSGGDPYGEDMDIPMPCEVVSSNELECTVVPHEYDDYDYSIGPYDLRVTTGGGTAVLKNAFDFTKSSICRNADANSDCQVDVDDNMVPVAYDDSDGNWYVVAQSDIGGDPGSWYDYGKRKWANAVTLTANGLAKYRNQPTGTKVDEQYVLGYWVYIPRYAYKVMRKEVANHVITDEEAKARGGFSIRFEKAGDSVKTPTSICDTSSIDYWECVAQTSEYKFLYYSDDDQYANQTVWATHPAFDWNGSEINGFWIGKFETTGTIDLPTVLPNRKHIGDTGLNYGGAGGYYEMAKKVGVEDPQNVYGYTATTSFNNGRGHHNLSKAMSHMLKSSEWGATAYLSASTYGAGVDGVQINAQSQAGTDDNGAPSNGVTGCGPVDDGKTTMYANGGQIGTANACSDGGVTHAYNGSLGVKSSTTNNVYGVYDMSGGAYEYVMGSFSSDGVQSSRGSNGFVYFNIPAREPYVDLYDGSIFNAGSQWTNNNLCTWAECGGRALYETKNVSLVTSELESWNGGLSYFVQNDSQAWFGMGGNYANGQAAGLFTAYRSNGAANSEGGVGFRVALQL